jgi:hypothetical protein
VLKGYSRQHFEEPWQRYLAAQGVYEPLQRYSTDGIDACGSFQTATEKVSVADQKCEKPPTNGHCSGVAVSEEGGHGDSLWCDHCRKPGNLGKVGYGDLIAWLHRDCRNAWRADQDKSGVQVVLRHPTHPIGGVP